MKLMQVGYNHALFQWFKNQRIFLRRAGGNDTRFRDGETILFYPETCFGQGFGFYKGSRLPLRAGHYSFSYSSFNDPVAIGNYCSIAESVSVFGYEHPTNLVTTSPLLYDSYLPLFSAADVSGISPMERPEHPVTVIENDVWVGRGVLIKAGVTLRTGCIVGAGSVVTKDVEPYAIVAGSPARQIRKRFDDFIIERLLQSEWFFHGPEVLSGLNYSDIYESLDVLKKNLEICEPLPELKNFLDELSPFIKN